MALQTLHVNIHYKSSKCRYFYHKIPKIICVHFLFIFKITAITCVKLFYRTVSQEFMSTKYKTVHYTFYKKNPCKTVLQII